MRASLKKRLDDIAVRAHRRLTTFTTEEETHIRLRVCRIRQEAEAQGVELSSCPDRDKPPGCENKDAESLTDDEVLATVAPSLSRWEKELGLPLESDDEGMH